MNSIQRVTERYRTMTTDDASNEMNLLQTAQKNEAEEPHASVPESSEEVSNHDVLPEADEEDAGSKKKKAKKKKTVGQEIMSWVLTLLAAVLIAGAIKAFVFEPIRVDGSSMLNTLEDGDIVIVTKPSLLLGNLNRGDVVICRFPNRNKELSLSIGAPLDVSFVTHTLFVKRLVAMPGDAVAVLDGILYVNDKPIDEPYVDFPSKRDYPKRVLGEDQYMVMGDNRAGSHDSTSADVGPISRDMIVGHAKLLVYPFNKFGIIK